MRAIARLGWLAGLLCCPVASFPPKAPVVIVVVAQSAAQGLSIESESKVSVRVVVRSQVVRGKVSDDSNERQEVGGGRWRWASSRLRTVGEGQ